MGKTFFTFSLGCKVNSYENASIASELLKNGFCEDKENPDFVIINTCSVTATADQKSRQHIRKFKNNYPNAKIVVMGCYAQRNFEYISSEIDPYILVGTSNRDKIVKYILEDKKVVDVNSDENSFKYEELGVTSYTENIRAYLKIQDGCNNFCSYCLIPYLRGRSRSRYPKNIIKEAECLIDQGYKEIVLTGIDVGNYGKDIGNITFSDLIETLLKLPNLYSLRISSIEASQIDDKFLTLFATYPNFAKHLHIPLQSGSESVLKRMNRKYDKATFLNTIQKIRSLVPDFALSTDVIVGFPGETSEEFEETYNFIQQCGFNMLHVFPYSARKGTLAEKMKNAVNPDIKKERVHHLLLLSENLWIKYVSKFVNKNVNVLIEKYDSSKKVNIGHTTNYIEVAIPSLEGRVGDVINHQLVFNEIISK